MSNDTIISFSDPAFHDELTELVRGGARYPVYAESGAQAMICRRLECLRVYVLHDLKQRQQGVTISQSSTWALSGQHINSVLYISQNALSVTS